MIRTKSAVPHFPIVAVAEWLGLEVKKKQARCFNSGEHKNGDRHFSLGLDARTDRFKCFACGVKGSAVDLCMQVKGIPFREAIVELKKEFGLVSPVLPRARDRTIRTYQSAPAREESAERDWLIYESLEKFCNGLDLTSYEYLTGATRDLTDETIKRFRIFSVKDYRATDAYLKKTFPLNDLRASGLLDDWGDLIFCRHKVVIPFLRAGRIVYLQGRRIEEGGYSKYWNLPKAVPLFNADTLNDLDTSGRAYICEGVFDAMMLEQDGQKATATLGVHNFKAEWVNLFSGLETVLMFDNDRAGREGIEKVAELFKERGERVITKRLPDGVKDITELYLKARSDGDF